MAVRVRLRQRELSDKAEYIKWDSADSYEIADDNTIEIRSRGATIAHVHPDSWDAVSITDKGPKK